VTTPADFWAPFRLRVRCGPLELRAITDDDIGPLIDLAAAGIHAPGEMPFAQPWTDVAPGVLPRNVAAYYWGTRASFSPADCVLDLAVRVNGEIVGVQGFHATDYLVLRTGETGSWPGRRFQGGGIGTAMRRAMCGAAVRPPRRARDHLRRVHRQPSLVGGEPQSRVRRQRNLP